TQLGIYPSIATNNQQAAGLFSSAAVAGDNLNIQITPGAQPTVKDLRTGLVYGLNAGVITDTAALNAGSISLVTANESFRAPLVVLSPVTAASATGSGTSTVSLVSLSGITVTGAVSNNGSSLHGAGIELMSTG